MQIIKYNKKYKDEMIQMFANLQDFERNLYPEREEGQKVARNFIKRYRPRRNKELILLGLEKEKVIGFVWITFSNDMLNKPEFKYMEISDIYIKEEFRSKGYGKVLIEEVERFAKEMKVKGISLSYLYKNTNAGKVYKKLGYNKLLVTRYKRLK